MSEAHYLPMDKLWALVDRLTTENAALVDELERTAAELEIATQKVAGLCRFLRTEMQRDPTDFPDTPGNQENTGE